MGKYQIDNATYPGAFAAEIGIPITVETSPRVRLKKKQKADLKINEPLRICLDDAVEAAERYLFIKGNPACAPEIVEDWKNTLRWELNTFWLLDSAANSYRESDLVRDTLTGEHIKRSGELLAQGIAIRLLEDRLGVKRHHFFFLKGRTARPDFEFRARRRLAMAFKGQRIGLEVRSRASRLSLSKRDVKSLVKKKKYPGLAAFMAVYCYYRNGTHADGTPKTRIHIADPEGNDAPLTDLDKAGIVVQHYLGVTSRIGLWDHRDLLERAAKMLKRDEIPHERIDLTSNAARINRGEIRSIGGEEYRGRFFSSLLGLVQGRTAAPFGMQRSILEEAQRRINQREFGKLAFYGLHNDVLHFIEGSEWNRLFDFSTPTLRTEQGVSVHSDGTVRYTRNVMPDSQDARDILQQLRGVSGLQTDNT